ncbi:hypothetical protein [Streptomyces sp. MK37H]|uniref:hypothetical protein n=1 Tax=Streptomyces sp. MK37H TaxID=2699117 RepID=UPI001B3639A6|nr:hypothetical protein [Streptomyces sp. MK37H]
MSRSLCAPLPDRIADDLILQGVRELLPFPIDTPALVATSLSVAPGCSARNARAASRRRAASSGREQPSAPTRTSE